MGKGRVKGILRGGLLLFSGLDSRVFSGHFELQ